MVPQSQAALSKTTPTPITGAVADVRVQPKRWPMALSILGAVGASLALWAGIFWLVSALAAVFR